jgi:hypothetical protein
LPLPHISDITDSDCGQGANHHENYIRVRHPDESMKSIAWICVGLLFVLLAVNASAFPLSGGNGAVDATVFGVVKSDGSLAADNTILMDLAIHENVSTPPSMNFQLIDSDDKAYATKEWIPIDNINNPDSKYRTVIQFQVPKGAIIKRLKITPETSDPFSVDWEGVPEASNDNTTMKFYGSSIAYVGSMLKKRMVFDVKLTNTGQETLTYGTKEFMIIDQFGWAYEASGTDAAKLLPDESLRFNVDVNMFQLSRPITLVFKGMEMDISSWA